MYKLIEGFVELVLGLLFGANGVNIVFENITFNRLCGTIGVGDPAPAAPPSIWIGIICIIVGLAACAWAVRNIVVGVKQILTDMKTNVHGVELFGIVAETKGVRGHSDGSLFQVADVGVLQKDKTIRHFRSALKIGEQYDVGDFVCVKYFENDINVLRIAEPTEIPEDVVQLLKYYPSFWNKGYVGEYMIYGEENPDFRTIVINGSRHNTSFTYDADKDEGFYQGDSGAFYTDIEN